MKMIHDWSIKGADDQPILGNTHVPADGSVGVLLIAHGFKGYKDYGFFPYLAHEASKRGLVTHRFNFSHSGMTNRIETFERPDLFEADTWSKQIHDMLAVASAVKSGKLAGEAPTRPVIWFGHSRGGVTALLTAGHVCGDDASGGDLDVPAGVIAAASPDTANQLDEAQAALLRRRGWLESPSSRTGQVLRIGRDLLLEVEADPPAYEPMHAVERVTCPMLMLHGDLDQTVPEQASRRLAGQAGSRGRLHIIRGASHTFNAPNPMDPDAEPPEATKEMVDAVCEFALEVAARYEAPDAGHTR